MNKENWITVSELSEQLKVTEPALLQLLSKINRRTVEISGVWYTPSLETQVLLNDFSTKVEEKKAKRSSQDAIRRARNRFAEQIGKALLESDPGTGLKISTSIRNDFRKEDLVLLGLDPYDPDKGYFSETFKEGWRNSLIRSSLKTFVRNENLTEGGNG